MPDEIVLPAGTEYVATADIPELITRVLHADAPEPPLKAERDHRQAIVAAIRGGGLKVVAPDTRLATDEYHPNSQVSVEELRRYVAQFKIVVLMGSAVAFSEDDRHRFVNAQYWSERDLLALCLPEEQPKYDAQYIAAWWEGEVDASTVWEAESVTAQQAAMALCGFNPYMASPSEAEQVTKPDETTPDDYKRLMFVFEAKERAEPKHRKLAEWLGIARARAVKYHSWIDTWLAATGKDAPSVSVSPAEGSLPSTGTTHRMNTRVHPLRAVMDAAKAAAVSSTDYHSVWAALVRLAEADSRPAPLLGYVEGEGVKYQTDKDIKFFTKDALRKQMNPNAR